MENSSIQKRTVIFVQTNLLLIYFTLPDLVLVKFSYRNCKVPLTTVNQGKGALNIVTSRLANSSTIQWVVGCTELDVLYKIQILQQL